METTSCPECLSEVPAEASVCRCCGERIAGIRCEECLALSPVGARKCRWCGTRLKVATDVKLDAFEVQATFLGSLVNHGSLIPQRAFFTAEKIVVRTYGFLGLTSNDEEILWEKVAGFAHRNGLIWDAISIETRGQTRAWISGLTKADGDKIRSVLQRLEK